MLPSSYSLSRLQIVLMIERKVLLGQYVNGQNMSGNKNLSDIGNNNTNDSDTISSLPLPIRPPFASS
jgi:hypothetical protein